MAETYTVSLCPCGNLACKVWHVWPVAAVQGVRFTEEQAHAVARLLNLMEVERAEEPVELDFERIEARVILQMFLRSSGFERNTSDVLASPCVCCGYNGEGYWQAGTHNVGCLWRVVGGVYERLKILENAMEKARG